MRSDHQKRVDRFMELAEQNLPLSPSIPSEETRKLRAKLIFEECLETIDALGVSLTTGAGAFAINKDANIEYTVDHDPDLIEIADGCADVMVVTTGTLSACGIDDIELQTIVDENNLAKFGPGGHRREDGKWVKPPGHIPPDIRKVIENQRKDVENGKTSGSSA